MVELFVNSGDPDKTPRSVASELGLQCLPVTRLGVFSLQWVKRSRMIGKKGLVLFLFPHRTYILDIC